MHVHAHLPLQPSPREPSPIAGGNLHLKVGGGVGALGHPEYVYFHCHCVL